MNFALASKSMCTRLSTSNVFAPSRSCIGCAAFSTRVKSVSKYSRRVATSRRKCKRILTPAREQGSGGLTNWNEPEQTIRARAIIRAAQGSRAPEQDRIEVPPADLAAWSGSLASFQLLGD